MRVCGHGEDRPENGVNLEAIEPQLNQIRFAATIKLKETTAFQLFRRLSSYSHQHPLYGALKALVKSLTPFFCFATLMIILSGKHLKCYYLLELPLPVRNTSKYAQRRRSNQTIRRFSNKDRDHASYSLKRDSLASLKA
jgi:hypothetical protein